MKILVTAILNLESCPPRLLTNYLMFTSKFVVWVQINQSTIQECHYKKWADSIYGAYCIYDMEGGVFTHYTVISICFKFHSCEMNVHMLKTHGVLGPGIDRGFGGSNQLNPWSTNKLNSFTTTSFMGCFSILNYYFY